ncbi:cytochrome b [Vreelandella malpeensis]|uniref:Cytochrome b n=1 Tax=Vreelandella malpeensis TaxID=1172368 RepID=A0ABS8DPS1_9GAMM|nr:cytochrome b/b6 domain-containing protein [Halomonas malpeensis]MCB8887870.1 cytochrome b [Halomonas malpeensis]
MHELDHYIYPHRVLHWLVAGAVLVSLATGLTLGTLGFERTAEMVGSATTNVMYTTHKTMGVLILLLMTLRILTRLAFVVPDHDPPLNLFERILSTSVHHLLYLALVLMPLLGWAATATGGYPVEFFVWHLPGLVGRHPELSSTLFAWHGFLGWAIVVLLVLHLLGALYHWRIKRDGVMTRMSLFD